MDADALQILTWTTGLLIFAGVLGLVTSQFPGVLVIWASVFAYSLFTNFSVLSQNVLLTITLLCGVIIAIDVVASHRGTRHMHVSYLIVLGALSVGLLIMTITNNSLLWFLFGAIAGGAMVALLTGHDEIYKLETKKNIIIGFAGATILKILVGLTVLVIFIQKGIVMTL